MNKTIFFQKCFVTFLFGLLTLITFRNNLSAEELLEYKPTYQQNKKAFLELVQSAHKINKQITALSWPNIINSDLTTDLLLFKDQKKAQQEVIIFSSGIHGIEGYVGSAIERWLIKNYLQELSKNRDVLMIHTLNPWGMQNYRRVDQNNIDLNRNFSNNSALYQSTNNNYIQINDFLNPEEPLDLWFLHSLQFIFKSIFLISQKSIETLRNSILQGQYQNPKGLYFGGFEAQPLQTNIKNLIQKNLYNYSRIIWIDLHTGYGERAKLHLLSNETQESQIKKIKNTFSNSNIDFGSQKKFYQTTGDLTSYLMSLSQNTKQEIYSLAFEYGTMDSQNTLGSIESLRRMVIENQLSQNGPANQSSLVQTQKLFKDMFYLEDEDWTKRIQSQTLIALKPFLN